jgi:replicative DNA helicase
MVSGSVLEHAGIVKRLSTSRQLMESCHHALREITEGKLTPEEIGDNLSSDALQITSGTIKRTELLDWLDTGRAYVSHLQRVMAAREAGQEVGVYTGLSFIDRYTSGIGPGELCFLAGEPGSGKSAVAWTVGPGFAARSLARPCAVGQRPVGTLMLSLEMPLISSTMRMVQSLTGIDGTRLREGKITKSEYRQILTEWKNRENLPIFWNFASNFRLSQMRALIAEAIRRANVGFVIIDHFRMVDTDRVYQNANQEDEAKVRFLKENIAMDLDVAVMCLAHTVKVGRGQGEESPKPRLSDLRGSGQIAAHADMVGFVWSPTKYMSDEAKTELDVDPEDMNISWEKSRFGAPATTGFKFNAQKMSVRDA